MKKRFKKTGFALFLIVVIQLFLLINIPTSHSYFLKILNIDETGIVSAQPSSWCCPETKNGAMCQDVLPESTQCATDLIETSCEFTTDCELGCCYDAQEGTCSSNSPKKECEGDGGEWYESCSIPECEKGCCVLGNNVIFETERTCEIQSELLGFDKIFDSSISNSLECLALSLGIEEGACVSESGVCKRESEENCILRGGNFHRSYLCSHPILNTTCEKQYSIGCVEGKDEIYWIDSCGNPENIYSSNKEKSWNNGLILPKDQSCNFGLSNIDSEICGNCKALESKCSATEPGEGVKDGDFICEDLKCVDDEGNIWQNGESWCDYDSYIGDGKDTVGSRHWRKICSEGEIKIEPCADYRTHLCAETTVEDFGEEFTFSQCVSNNAVVCMSYNNQDEAERLCNEHPQCIYKNINIDSQFKFSVCVPKYPPGTSLTGNAGANYCSFGTMTCTYLEKKGWDFDWHCQVNCDCKRAEFTKKMNDFCISLGDCGAYVNYVGEGTNSYSVTRAPDISWKDYIEYANPVEGQNVDLEEIADYISTIVPSENIPELEFIETIAELSQTLFYVELGAQLLLSSSEIAWVSKLGNAIQGAAAGFAVGLILGDMFGFGETGQWITAGIMATLGLFNVIPGLNVITFIFQIIGWIGGVGETREKEVHFTCKKWQPPIGGEDCYLCNEDPEKPCSQYRCESLGTACRLINDFTENPTCESLPNDATTPVITPGEIEEGYKFIEESVKKIKIVKEQGEECIQEFTPIKFSLETDEFAECRYHLFNRTDEFADMIGDFEESNTFSKTHNLTLNMPSVGSLGNNYIIEDVFKKYGNFTMYVRCRDYHGNANIEEYAIRLCIYSGPDIMEVNHLFTKTIPKSGSYLEFGKNEIDFIMHINEPAECKYSLSPDKDYDDMENEMNCELDVNNRDLEGWKCETTLEELDKNENKIYIKCLDQPWFKGTENESQRNVNTEDFVYILFSSESELEIDSINPFIDEKIVKGFEPIDVILEVETSGGSENGKSVCFWGTKENGGRVPMLHTESNYHTQTLNDWYEGKYKVYIECEDSAGNNVSDLTEFEIEEGKLKILTNEEAACYYVLNRCNFNVDEGNAEAMSIGLSKIHSTDWNPTATYHIKCIDVWNNQKIGCTKIIKPESF